MRVCPTSLELDLARDTVPPTDHRLALWTHHCGHLETQPTSR